MPTFDLQNSIAEHLRDCAAGSDSFPADFDPMVRPADPRFGDFQANGILSAAKRIGANPRQLADELAGLARNHPALGPNDFRLEVAGPGFLNFSLVPGHLTAWARTFGDARRLSEGIRHLYAGKRVVVDYSSPNTAKQMHVGHIRSTVIGEAIARLLAFCGAEVIRDNHIGDWGTQFGVLLLAVRRFGFDFETTPDEALPALEDLYRRGNALVEEEAEAREEARRELLALQRGDPERQRVWGQINDLSRSAFDELYARLGVEFDLTLGESFYRDRVESVYADLTRLGIAEESEGALAVFHREHPRFREQPFLVRKSDGASNYATTDLATIRYRAEELRAGEIVYVTDGRQRDHFEQLFLTARKWFEAEGKPIPELRHVWFGTILGEGGKAIKTRSGRSIKLRELLDEGVERARAIVEEKNPDLPGAEKDRIAESVGLAAIRYADLMQNRTQDYVFSWDKMLAFDGNTAPYLLYATARIHAIFRKAGLRPGEAEEEADAFETPEELRLARQLVLFPGALSQVTQDLRPHFLCTYLYELANGFSAFYNANRVMTDDPGERARRLVLCSRTLLFLETGLRLLGIEPLERM